MEKARIVLDKEFEIAQVDNRLYGFFVEHMGRGVYNGIFEPGHPKADKAGFREDVKELVRSLNIPVIRYPGGNMVSGFCWEDSVGPVGKRPRRLELSRKSIEPNLVGLHEFYTWAKQVESSVLYTVNLGTRGPAEARDVVEYCNHPSGSLYSDMRRKNGFNEPMHIKTWCLGNEMDGNWQICHKNGMEYGKIAREAAKLMRWTDPKIELVAVGATGGTLPNFGQWTWDMLDECYDQIEYVAVHKYFNNAETDSASYLAMDTELADFFRTVISLCDGMKGKKHSTKSLYLALDEWNALHRMDVEQHPERMRMPKLQDEWKVGVPLIEFCYTQEDAVMVGLVLITMLHHADRVKIGCLAQLVNVIAPIMTEIGGSVWLQTIYWPLYHASLYGRGTALMSSVSSPMGDGGVYGSVPMVCAAAVRNDDGCISIFAVNRSPSETLPFEVVLRDFDGEFKVQSQSLSADSPNAANTVSQPNRVVPGAWQTVDKEDGAFIQPLPPMSWNVIRFTKEKLD